MKSLCVDVRLLHGGGIGTFLKSLLPDLATHFHLSLLHRPQDEEALKHLSAALIPIKSPIYSLREQIELPWKIPACDIFWAPHFNIPLLPIRARKRLTTLNDTFHLAHFSQLSLLQKLYAKLFYNCALLYSDHVTTISDFSKAQIAAYCRVQPKALTRIYDGIALKPTVRSPRYVLAFGGKPHKNLARVREAVKLAGEELVVADGSLPDSDIPELYSGAKLLLFPSLYEGFGYPPLEAMQCGVPVITSRRGSLPEICGNAAEYVDPLDVEAMAAKIKELLGNPARCAELEAKGKERVALFTAHRCFAQYCMLMEEM